LAVAQAVAAWRERRAAEADITPRFVLSDLGVVSIASSAPSTVEELRQLRGVDGRALKGGSGEELLRAVQQARDASPAPREDTSPVELEAELRPVVPLISAWVSQRARELDLETSLLATRSDLEQLLRGDEGARLSHGWRAEIVGEPIRNLVAGRMALVFRRGEGLELVDLNG
jgi:ribonuclease D